MPLLFISIHRRVGEGLGCEGSHILRVSKAFFFLFFFYPTLRREQSQTIKNRDLRKVPPSIVLNPQRTFDLTEAEMKKNWRVA